MLLIIQNLSKKAFHVSVYVRGRTEVIKNGKCFCSPEVSHGKTHANTNHTSNLHVQTHRKITNAGARQSDQNEVNRVGGERL